MAATREAIVNSLCHRDFSNPKGNEIAIFKNRIEIYNPGGLPEGITPDDFITGNERSYLRNPLIANAFYRTKDIEKWGSGLKRIYDECQDFGITVTFQILKTGFLTTFYRPVSEKEVSENWENGGQKSGQKISERQAEILKLILQNSKITRTDLVKALKINPSAIQKHINVLKNKGIIKRIGPDKGGYWEVIKKELD